MRNTWIELDLGILGENLRAIRAALNPSTEIVLVVKANAYGHGMVAVARRAWECDIKWFAVAHVDEAVNLRTALPDAGIIILGVMDPSDTITAIEKKLIPLIVSEKHTHALASEASSHQKVLRCHAKVDSGMGRLGFAWRDAGTIIPGLARQLGLEICGICTNFATSDSPKRTYSDIQAERFLKVIRFCEKTGMNVGFKHISNSGAILREPTWEMDGVRPGILAYGYARKAEGENGAAGRSISTRPFLQWKTRVVQVKKVPAGFSVSYDCTHMTVAETCVATINVGYADGYPRALSNKGQVIIGGKRHPVVGRVTMNLVMVDVGLKTNVVEGDEVVLVGTQGNESIWADELAGWCGTISYEILTGIRTEDRRPAFAKATAGK